MKCGGGAAADRGQKPVKQNAYPGADSHKRIV